MITSTLTALCLAAYETGFGSQTALVASAGFGGTRLYPGLH